VSSVDNTFAVMGRGSGAAQPFGPRAEKRKLRDHSTRAVSQSPAVGSRGSLRDFLVPHCAFLCSTIATAAQPHSFRSIHDQRDQTLTNSVLSRVSQPPPPGRSRRDPHAGRQLPRSANSPGGDLRDQPRALAAPRGAVRTGGERCARTAHRTDRHSRRRAAPRQRGRGVARRRTRLARDRGGGR
jgi:hypothetical protein